MVRPEAPASIGRVPLQLKERLLCKPGCDLQGARLDPAAVQQSLAHDLATCIVYSDLYHRLVIAEQQCNRKAVSHWGAVPRRNACWGAVSERTRQSCKWPCERRWMSATSFYRDPGNWLYATYLKVLAMAWFATRPADDASLTLRCTEQSGTASFERCGDTIEAFLGEWLSQLPAESWERIPWNVSMLRENVQSNAVARFLVSFQTLEDLTTVMGLEQDATAAARTIWQCIQARLQEEVTWMRDDNFEGRGARSLHGAQRQKARDKARAAARSAAGVRGGRQWSSTWASHDWTDGAASTSWSSSSWAAHGWTQGTSPAGDGSQWADSAAAAAWRQDGAGDALPHPFLPGEDEKFWNIYNEVDIQNVTLVPPTGGDPPGRCTSPAGDGASRDWATRGSRWVDVKDEEPTVKEEDSEVDWD